MFPATLYTDTCQDVFGDDFTEENIEKYVRATNIEFGGKTPDTENIYMTHGGLDPWKAVGSDEEQGAVIIPLYSHCCDRESVAATDSAELAASKQRLIELIREWLE